MPAHKIRFWLILNQIFKLPLIITFDDGYADAAQFIQSNANKYPNIHWILFICPEKAVKQVGFRWDTNLNNNPPFCPYTENTHSHLIETAKKQPFKLANHEQILLIQSLSNVSIGNHTNCHFKLIDLDDNTLISELQNSFDTFEQYFGKCTHFAFPYGTPNIDYDFRATDWLKKNKPYCQAWSSEARWGKSKNGIHPRISFPNISLIQQIILICWFRAKEYLKK